MACPLAFGRPRLQPVIHPDARRVDKRLAKHLDDVEAPERLLDAMRYVVLGGGKRLRARLVYATGRLLDADESLLDRAAVAIELVHAYSLVHDDLPAMDDDDLRRGRPTAHRRYDEATAILVGDALQTLAFEVLADDSVPAELARYWVQVLAAAAGPAGMVGGQMLDLLAENTQPSARQLKDLYERKTAALLRASVLMAATSVRAEPGVIRALDAFAKELGLAYQIHDDVLDETASTQTLGKPQGADRRRGQPTFVSLLGVDGARRMADRHLGRACDLIEEFGARANELRRLARRMVERTH